MEKSKSETRPTKLEAAMGWVDKRFPATETFEYHMSKYYAPKNFNFLVLLWLSSHVRTG